ncbi:hypothetical protein GJ691_11385 [Maribacter sp. RZ05]|uniref:Uncharacterized protein n=1 Tax=Maribacter luteus TaxID=2594478 RepID=A0A6I2MPP8_9FLAO|nr:hypothetical protein [Maribacter luteus]
MDRNFRYARQEELSGKTVRPFLIDDRLQPEEIPEVHRETSEKRGGNACFVIFCKNRTLQARKVVFKPGKNNGIFGHLKNKTALKSGCGSHYSNNYRLVQRLPLLQTVFL